jgi:hypothetical protein
MPPQGGLDNHHRFVAALDLALPAVERDHAGQDVDAGGEPPFEQRPPRAFRLDNGWIGRIDENRAFHARLPPRRGTAALRRLLALRSRHAQATRPSKL